MKHAETKIYSRVPPKGVRLVWRGVRYHNRLAATPQRLTFFSGELNHKGCEFTFHYWSPFRAEIESLTNAWGTHPQLNWGLSMTTTGQGPQKVKATPRLQQWWTSFFPPETLATKSPSEWGGNANPFGEDVDPGLLLQSSKDQRIWVEGLGDLDDLSFQE